MMKRLVIAACFLSLSGFGVKSMAFAQKEQPKPAGKKKVQPPRFGVLQPIHEHIQKGRIAEAREALAAIEKTGKADAVQVAIFRSRCDAEQRDWKKAASTLSAALKTSPRKAVLHAKLAETQFQRGQYTEAEASATKAIKMDGNQPLAHLVLADVLTETGRTKKALEEYRWFVRYYNRVQPTDAESLLLVARGAIQYARWKSSSQIFRFAVNTLCPDALKDDADSWQAYYVSGSLLLEKYNRSQAMPEFDKALAINPNAVHVLVALGEAARQKNDFDKAGEYADRALKAAPLDVPALQLKADVLFYAGKLNDAEARLKTALEVNPREQRTIARLAAIYLLSDGPPAEKLLQDLLTNIDAVKNITADKPDRFTKLAIALGKQNPRPGYFLTLVAERLEERRKFDLAEKFYKTAMRVMPELAEPKNSLGMLYMRVGRTKDARKILDEAFKADPFHVRISNMRKVLKVLDGYETIATPHFVIRLDSKVDGVLGLYLSEYLEEIYPELVKQFGYEPPTRTQFEIYNKANGLSGHEWFAARLVGLPWIHTIGASTGMMVALTSPTAGDKPFNWARVVKHEFVHIITLQQTKFNIPHWFTEALAVTAEGYPRTETWDKLLLQRVPKGELRTLANLSDGFIRPRNSLDWQFAYCQSHLYAQYMVAKYGKESIPKMLDAYRRNLSTPNAVKASCGVDIATFEKGYLEFVQAIVKDLKVGEPESQKTLAELEKAYKADETNTKAAGEYALALFDNKDRKAAREIAAKALEKNAKEPTAAVVMASMLLLTEDSDGARKVLEPAVDRKAPHKRALLLLAQLKLQAEQNGDAADLLEAGRKRFPYDETLLLSLAKVYLKLDENDKLKPLLVSLAGRNFDDVSIRKSLTEISHKQKNYKDVVKYGREVLFIDVLDLDTHRLMGEAYRELKDYKKSVREFKVSLQLKPGDAALQIALAKTHIAAGDKDQAKTVLDAVLKTDPENAAAKALRSQL